MCPARLLSVPSDDSAWSVMRKWQTVGGLLFLGSLVACATATNSGTPVGDETTDTGGTDSAGGSPGGGGMVDPPASGSGSVTAGTGSTVGGAPSAGAGQLAFGGSAAMTGGASGTGTGGASGAAGAHTGGSSGTSSGGTSSGGTTGAGGAAGGSAGGTSTGPCANPKDVTGGNSGALGPGVACLRTTQTFNEVGCSSFDGRTLKVNGVAAMCNTPMTFTPIGGYNYFEVSAGMYDYASLNWFCTLMSC
jgi:hypothetical protein